MTYGKIYKRLKEILHADSEWLAFSNNIVNTYSRAAVRFENEVEPKRYPCKVKANISTYQGKYIINVAFEYDNDNTNWRIIAQRQIESRLKLYKNDIEVKTIYSAQEFIDTLVNIVMDTEHNNYKFKRNGEFYNIDSCGNIEVLPSKLGIKII